MSNIKPIIFTAFVVLQAADSARIEMTPTNFEGLVTTSVNISCVPDTVQNFIKEVVNIQMVRGEQQLASIRQGSQIAYGSDLTTIVQAEGLIDSNATKCFLRLTLPHVLIRDSGKYTCNIYFYDNVGFLHQETVWDNLVVDDQDIQNHLAFLIKKVFIQEDIIRDQARLLATQSRKNEDQSNLLEIKSRRLGEQSQQLENKLDNLENEFRKESSYLSVFCASIKTRKYPVKKGDVLVFGDVLTKEGKGYDENTGHFTAPYRGLYRFYLSLFIAHADKYIQATIQVEDREVAFLQTGDQKFYDQSSVDCFVLLEAGDVVKVVVYGSSSGSILSPYKHDSVFSGYLVKPI